MTERWKAGLKRECVEFPEECESYSTENEGDGKFSIRAIRWAHCGLGRVSWNREQNGLGSELRCSLQKRVPISDHHFALLMCRVGQAGPGGRKGILRP